MENRLTPIIAEAKAVNQRRRTEVLKHEDLRKRLEAEPLNFARADQWNGFIPPATVNEFSSEELCQVRSTVGQPVRFNQLAHYGTGETVNDSPRRAALVEISAQAWERRGGVV